MAHMQASAVRLSAQQQAVVAAVAQGEMHVEVQARAGCGKTTTILAAGAAAEGSVILLAFNKSIASELAAKAPGNMEVRTLHSLGFAAVRKAYPLATVEADKTWKILQQLERQGRSSADLGTAKRLVSLCKNLLLDEPSDDALFDLSATYDCALEDEQEEATFQRVRQALRFSLPPAKGPVLVDFDDMVWWPSVLELGLPRYDWTFVDEAQDLNPVQHELVMRISQGGRVCYVGDPFQAIYAFRGADSRSMDTLRERLGGSGKVRTLMLTLTRRCPKKVVAEAAKDVPDFEALPEAPEGVVRTSTQFEPAPGDMVLCRMNAPLVAPAFRLIRAGVPVKIMGRDIGSGLTALVRRLKASSVDDLTGRLDAYAVRESARIAKRYEDLPTKLEQASAALADRIETLRALCDAQSTVDGVLDMIQRLFSDVQGADGVVLFSTVHKAKGLEAPRVWIIRTKERGGEQERNARYVAVTRAKQELVFVPEEAVA